MPVFDDILDNEVLGREYRRGLERRREEGAKNRSQEGRQTELTLLRTLMENRFGLIPDALEAKLSCMSPTELEQLASRVSHAATIDELLS